MAFLRQIGRGALWIFCTRLLWILFTVCYRVRIIYYDSLPTGGFIVASNHISHFDPPLIGTYFRRKIDWLGMAELFHGPVLTFLFTALGVIPIDRQGKDRTALREAVRRLKTGRVVGIFPEGGIRDGAASIVNGARMKGGVSVLASLSGVPIVPAIILGSDRLYNSKNWRPWRRRLILIGVGTPITLPGEVPGDDKRGYLDQALSAAIISLRDRLTQDFALTKADLPHSPQARMREP